MKQAMTLVGSILGVCAFLLFLGFGIEGSVFAPNNALVFVDVNQNMYLAPPCVPREKWLLYSRMTIEQVHKLNLNPEPKCRDEGAFTQEDRSLSGQLFEKLGLLSSPKSRWNPDGTWNW